MDHNHPHGKPISILRFSESKEVIVDNQELDKIFNHPEIQDRKVVIFSLIGAYRGGKSFFLNYCLRFLYAHFQSINNRNRSIQSSFRKDDNWMGRPDEPLKGFLWRSGAKRETIGINIWSDVFLHTLDRTGEKIAIFVMDTQGLFDNESTPTDNSRIFALGTLISSIQVFNLKQHIQEDQLQYLQFATELAQFCVKKEGNKVLNTPFQNLTFLIRDWDNGDEYGFGIHGGAKYLEKIMEINSTQKEELRSVRENMRNSFEKIQCCLLPNPGKKIAGRKNFNGMWSEMDDDFKDELKIFIEYFLAPENMTMKKLNFQKLLVKEVKMLIEQYLKLFQSGEIPKTQTLFQSFLESSMGNLIKKCVNEYRAGFKSDSDLKDENSIPKVHKKWEQNSIKMFNGDEKMGDKEQEDKFRYVLKKKLQETYNELKGNYEKIFHEKRKAEEERAKKEEEKRLRLKAEEETRRKEAELKEAQAEMELKERIRQNELKAEEERRRNEQKQRVNQELKEYITQSTVRNLEELARDSKLREIQNNMERERIRAIEERKNYEEKQRELQEKEIEAKIEREANEVNEGAMRGKRFFGGLKAFGMLVAATASTITVSVASLPIVVGVATVATVGTAAAIVGAIAEFKINEIEKENKIKQ